MRIFFDGIPLVHNDHGRLALLVHVPDDLNVLFGDSFAAVYHKHANVRAAHRVERAQNRIIFHVVFHRTLAANPRRVDYRILLPVPFEQRVDRVARRARNIGYDASLRTQQLVHKRRFSRVRLSHHGNF